MKNRLFCILLVINMLTVILLTGCTGVQDGSAVSPTDAQKSLSGSPVSTEGATSNNQPGEQADLAATGTDEEDASVSTPTGGEEASANNSKWKIVMETAINHKTHMEGFLNENFGFTVGYAGETHYSNDGGQTWPKSEIKSILFQ